MTRIVGLSIVPRNGKWYKETYIVTEPGKVIVHREPYNLPAKPPRENNTREEPIEQEDTETTIEEPVPGETGKYIIVHGIRWRVGLEDWEKPLLAAALYFVEPRPEEEVFKDMEELVGREMAERIAAQVWRIVYGEGYTLDEWASLLESLKILSPWECIWRFQELVEKGLRKRHTVEPAELEDKEILRTACKHMGTG